MRAILAGVMVLGLAGCGLRYIGTEDQMQQVARGTAELMKKNPYGDLVSGAGTAAHMVLSATMGPKTEAEAKPQIIGGFGEEARAQHEIYKQFLLKNPSLYGRGTESSAPEPEAEGFCVKTLTGCKVSLDYAKPND